MNTKLEKNQQYIEEIQAASIILVLGKNHKHICIKNILEFLSQIEMQ